MHLYVKSTFCFFFIFLNLGEATLRNCSEKHDQQDICMNGEEDYSYPLPVVLETWLYLNEIIKIDGNENSISMSVELITYWTDPQLGLSDDKG